MSNRFSGVLTHLTSLPGPYGIGTFGPEAHQFVQRLRQAGFSYWQVLPFSWVDEYFSPYKTVSAFAGNPMFIDPRLLVADGLLMPEELKQLGQAKRPDVADYPFAFELTDRALRLAYRRLTKALQVHIEAFVQKEWDWLRDFALFTVARETFGRKPWWQWPHQGLVQHEQVALERFAAEHEAELNFLYFQQWVFQRQWLALKNRANQLGLGVIGDIPFYVDQDSADVWAHRSLFEIEGTQFKRVAGVPPDYFSEEGQLWGNPLYDWPAHQAEDYRWWKARLARGLSLFDRVRLDHFRAFINYWAVDAGAKTAASGHWEVGPGQAFFEAVFGEACRDRLFAEDLGNMDDTVRQAIAESGLPGMEVLQFSFNPGDASHRPHRYRPHSVAYTGTHDNTTTLGWIWEASEEQRQYILSYLDFPLGQDWGQGGAKSPFCKTAIQRLWATAAELTLVPIQDLCGFGGDTRMNVPGRATENWAYRLPVGALEEIDWPHWQQINTLYDRNRPARETLLYQRQREAQGQEAL